MKYLQKNVPVLYSARFAMTVVLIALLCFGSRAAGLSVTDSVLTVGDDVTEIPAYAYKDRTDIVRIEFEGKSSLRKIGEYAFLGCTSLKEVVLPTGLTEMGEGCFRECSALKEISLPKGLTILPKGAFVWCKGLKKVKMPSGLADIGAHAFAYCTALEDVNIPSSVKHIGNNAFSNCETLWRVYIPSSVKELESYAFSGCINLREATLPANSSLLGELIFSGCDELRSLTLNIALPPKFDCDSGIFEPDANYNYSQCVLYVPDGFVHRYRMAKGWKYFVHILPIRK